MLLVCYKNHFNHRICRVLEKPSTPPLPAPRFKAVAIYLQLHSVCWIPYVHFHFSWRSQSIPRSTDERKACLCTNGGTGKLSSQEKKPWSLLLRRWYEIMALYYVKSIFTEISASRQDKRVLEKNKIIRMKFLSIWGMLQTSRYV